MWTCTRSRSPARTTTSTHPNVSVTRITKARPLVVFSTLYFSIACRFQIDFEGYDVIHGTLMPASTIALGPQFRRPGRAAGVDEPRHLLRRGAAVDPQSPPDYLFKYVFHPINVALDAVAGQFADHIIGVSDHTREQLRDLYRFDADDLTTVPPGIDADRFQPTDEVHPAIDTDRESILVLSRLDPRKGSTRRSGRSHSLNGRTQSC